MTRWGCCAPSPLAFAAAAAGRRWRPSMAGRGGAEEGGRRWWEIGNGVRAPKSVVAEGFVDESWALGARPAWPGRFSLFFFWVSGSCGDRAVPFMCRWQHFGFTIRRVIPRKSLYTNARNTYLVGNTDF
jgi:hypothetical protein